jgi:hypothetical protein
VRDLDVYHNTVYVTAATAGEPRGLWVGGGVSEGIRFRNKLSRAGFGETVGDPRRLDRLRSYRLRKGSPLAGAGLDLRALGLDPGPRDFFGGELAPSGPPDVGAHQRGRSPRTLRWDD